LWSPHKVSGSRGTASTDAENSVCKCGKYALQMRKKTWWFRGSDGMIQEWMDHSLDWLSGV